MEAMTIHEQIKEELKDAMRARDAVRLTTLRGLLTGFTNELVASKKKPDEILSDEEAIAVIKRAVKQRKDSILQFEKGGRPELAESEKKELAILETYLPATMSKEDIRRAAEAKKAELGMSDPTKKGIFMGTLMKELKDKADGADVKEVVDELFA